MEAQTSFERLLKQAVVETQAHMDDSKLEEVMRQLLMPSFEGDLSSHDVGNALARHVVKNLKPALHSCIDILPIEYVQPDKMVLLNIPMDEESPSRRLLRPQAMVQEYCLRHFTPTIAYRMNLKAGRSGNIEKEKERRRFLRIVSTASNLVK